MRVQFFSILASTALAFALNLLMAPSLELDVTGLRSGDHTGMLELKRNARRSELALVDLQVVASDIDMLFGRKERVRSVLLSATSEDGGDILLWASFAADGPSVPANARDAAAVTHRTLTIVPAPAALPATPSVTLPRKGVVELRGGTLRITSALPLSSKGGSARWTVRGEIDLELAPPEGESTEAWAGRFKGRLVWP